MRKLIFRSIGILFLAQLLISWGGTGHSIVSENVILSFNNEMELFNSWATYLVQHSSDADYRKSSDPNEAPKHYIDIDNYFDFNAYGSIPQTLDSVINRYGYYNVYSWGILPWATLTTYDSLKNAFIHHNFERAKFFAADLSHYVGDGHMPLHITANYNGQLTNNTGIHSRYESTMINNNVSNINYSGENIVQVANIRNYVFQYLYNNYKYVDSILLADNYAKSINSNTSSTEYKAALWDKSDEFTNYLLKNASHALAELIYSAWKQAGSPSLTDIQRSDYFNESMELSQNSPNPFTSNTNIKVQIVKPCYVTLKIYNTKGEALVTLEDSWLHEGEYNYTLTADRFVAGLYIIVLKNDKITLSTKMLVYH